MHKMIGSPILSYWFSSTVSGVNGFAHDYSVMMSSLRKVIRSENERHKLSSCSFICFKLITLPL